IDSLDIKGASFDEALEAVVQKVHSLGHAEVRLRIYSNGRECPYFRAPTRSDLYFGASTIDLNVVPDGSGKKMNYHGWTAAGESSSVNGSSGKRQIILRDVLSEIEFQFGLPCSIRGHDLVAAHTHGTLHRYVKETIRLYQWAWDGYTDQELAKLAKDN